MAALRRLVRGLPPARGMRGLAPKKFVKDAARAKAFAKLTSAITTAVHMGGEWARAAEPTPPRLSSRPIRSISGLPRLLSR